MHDHDIHDGRRHGRSRGHGGHCPPASGGVTPRPVVGVGLNGVLAAGEVARGPFANSGTLPNAAPPQGGSAAAACRLVPAPAV